MRLWSKVCLIVFLALLEVMLVEVIVGQVLPRRAADVDTFWKYYKTPTAENLESWRRERQKTLREVVLGKTVAGCLALGNILLIIKVFRKQTVR